VKVCVANWVAVGQRFTISVAPQTVRVRGQLPDHGKDDPAPVAMQYDAVKVGGAPQLATPTPTSTASVLTATPVLSSNCYMSEGDESWLVPVEDTIMDPTATPVSGLSCTNYDGPTFVAPASSTITSTIAVSDIGTVARAWVTVNSIIADYAPQVTDIELFSPTGKEIFLASDIAVNEIWEDDPGALGPMTFTEWGSSPVPLAIGSCLDYPCAGSWAPMYDYGGDSALHDLAGDATNGTWTLQASRGYGDATIDWTLTLCTGTAAPVSTPTLNVPPTIVYRPLRRLRLLLVGCRFL